MMNLSVKLKTIFCVCLALLITGCVSTRLYHTELISDRNNSLEQIRFETYNLAIERKDCQDKKYLKKLSESENETSRKHHDYLLKLKDYFTDDTLDYYDLIIFYYYGGENVDYVDFRFDSVVVSYDKDGDSLPQRLFPNTSTKVSGSEQISIYPIGISKEYKGDFYIKFNLYIENYKDEPDTTKVPIHLKCEPYKVTEVPILQGE